MLVGNQELTSTSSATRRLCGSVLMHRAYEAGSVCRNAWKVCPVGNKEKQGEPLRAFSQVKVVHFTVKRPPCQYFTIWSDVLDNMSIGQSAAFVLLIREIFFWWVFFIGKRKRIFPACKKQTKNAKSSFSSLQIFQFTSGVGWFSLDREGVENCSLQSNR